MRLAFPQRTVYAVSPSKFHSYRSTDTNSGTLTSVNVSVPAVTADPSRSGQVTDFDLILPAQQALKTVYARSAAEASRRYRV
jgi:hypothetical protein